MGVFRLFLALSVLLGHAHGHGFFGLSFLGAGLALQTFFVISGFYMALVLNEKYKPGQYGTFITQRFLRLYPTYLILLGLVIVIDGAVWLATGEPWGSLRFWSLYAHLLSPIQIATMVVGNIVIFGQDLMMLLFINPDSGAFSFTQPSGEPVTAEYFLLLATSWSLSLEFCFYLLAPLLVRRAAIVQIGILGLCYLLRLAVYQTAPPPAGSWLYFWFPPNLFYFVAGSLAYVIYKNYGAKLRAVATARPWIFLPLVVFGLDYSRFPLKDYLYLLWIPLAFIMIPFLFALTSRNRTDRLIGELSYPCYLVHPHVLMFVMPLLHKSSQAWAVGPLAFAITLSFSYVFYRLVESRTERFRENLYRKKHPHDYVQPAAFRAAETPASSLK